MSLDLGSKTLRLFLKYSMGVAWTVQYSYAGLVYWAGCGKSLFNLNKVVLEDPISDRLHEDGLALEKVNLCIQLYCLFLPFPRPALSPKELAVIASQAISKLDISYLRY